MNIRKLNLTGGVLKKKETQERGCNRTASGGLGKRRESKKSEEEILSGEREQKNKWSNDLQ